MFDNNQLKEKKILGMGNALLDILVKIPSDEVLNQLNLPKGSMQLVDKTVVQTVLKATNMYEKEVHSGGSAANTIAGIAQLGMKTAFIGMVGSDEYGENFHNDLVKSGTVSKLMKSPNESGTAVTLISQDSERTFATYLGAAIELSEQHLSSDLFSGYDYFHIEGYLVQNHNLIHRALELAKENGLQVSLDLASFNVVESNLEFLKTHIQEYVDIVFANEEEAKAFTGEDNPEIALDILSQYCKIAIVKIGKKGSLIKSAGRIYKIGIIPAESVDTTGAGDAYAAGFLAGLLQDLPLEKCGEFGSILSGNVIEFIGARIPETRWQDIHNTVKTV